MHFCYRPLWVEYPQDPATFAVDDEFLIGEKTQLPPRLEVSFSKKGKIPSKLSPVDQITWSPQTPINLNRGSTMHMNDLCLNS